MRVRRKLTIVIVIGIASFLLFPFNQPIAPKWELRVVDEKRQPLVGVTVREGWRPCIVMESSAEEKKQTDTDGRVHFPRRTHRSSLASRLLGCIRRIAEAGTHAACGLVSFFEVSGSGIETFESWDLKGFADKVEDVREDTFVLRHCSSAGPGVGCSKP